MATGHWLDALLGRSRLQIEWNGTPLTKRDTLAFSDDFEVLDSGLDGGRTVVNISSAFFLDMVGDVLGDSDDNQVAHLSGEGNTGIVTVFASSLHWDSDTSEGEAEISVSGGELDAGALQFLHAGKRALLALGSGPVLGNTTSINKLDGGASFTVRNVTGHITLDTTTKDMLVFVDASGERNIVLPAPTAGRTIFFIISGASAVSIRRPGSQLINGVASHYAAPADGRVMVTSDGTNYFTWAGLQ